MCIIFVIKNSFKRIPQSMHYFSDHETIFIKNENEK